MLKHDLIFFNGKINGFLLKTKMYQSDLFNELETFCKLALGIGAPAKPFRSVAKEWSASEVRKARPEAQRKGTLYEIFT